MPLYDYYCKICGSEELDIMCKVNEGVICKTCIKPMVRKCNCTHFKLIFDNKTQSCGWAATGYEHNQYWDEVKKQRAEGKKVKGVNEE